jgi:hydroxypyruvate isomerase
MKKSICLEMIYSEVDFYERFGLAKKDGFEFVEFWSWEDKNLKRIKQICQDLNLKIASFSGDKGFNLIDINEQDKYIEFIEKSIDSAKYLNCRTLVIHSNALGENGIVVNSYDNISKEEKFINMERTLLKLKPIAEKVGITLALEPLNIWVDHVGNALTNTADTVGLLKKINSNNIKMLYDVYHMQIDEGNIIATLKDNINYIGYIHIADVPGRHEPSTGEINFSNVFKALKEIKYERIVGFELSPKVNSKTAVEVIKNC